MIVILDFGSQYSELIARRIRETQVYSEVFSYRTSAEHLKKLNPKGIILSGGPSSVYDEGAPKCDPGIWDLGIPVLGVCYGMQLMVRSANMQRYDLLTSANFSASLDAGIGPSPMISLGTPATA